MSESTKIQWCKHTFNPWRGCTKVNAGCTNCYAEVNYSVKMHGVKWGPNGTRVRLSDAGWKELLKWNRQAECNCGAAGAGDRECDFCANGCNRPRVFCASLADVFEDWDGPLLDHTGRQLFTINGGDYFTEAEYPECRPATMDDLRADLFRLIDATPNLDWMLLTKRPENIRRMWSDVIIDGVFSFAPIRRRENVWLGTSCSDQQTADPMKSGHLYT